MKSFANGVLQTTAVALLFLMFFGVAHVEAALSPPRNKLGKGPPTAVSTDLKADTGWGIWESTFPLSGNPKEFLRNQAGQLSTFLLNNFFVKFVRDTFNNVIFRFVKWTEDTPLCYIFFSWDVQNADDASDSMFSGFINGIIVFMVMYSLCPWKKRVGRAVKDTLHHTYVFVAYFNSDHPKDAKYRLQELNFYSLAVSSYFNCIQDNMSLFAFSHLIVTVNFLYYVKPLYDAPESHMGNTTTAMVNLVGKCSIAETQSMSRTFYSFDYFFIYVINIIGNSAALMVYVTWPMMYACSAAYSVVMHGMSVVFIGISSVLNNEYIPLAALSLGRMVGAYGLRYLVPTMVSTDMLTSMGFPVMETDVMGAMLSGITDETCQRCGLISMLVHSLACGYSASKNPYNRLDTDKSHHLWWLKMGVPFLVGSGMLAYTLVTHPGKLTPEQQIRLCRYGAKSNVFFFGVSLYLLVRWFFAEPTFYTDETDEIEIDDAHETKRSPCGTSTAGQGDGECRPSRSESAESVTTR